MNSSNEKGQVSQKAKAKGNIQQVIGNYSQTTHVNLWVSFLLIGVLALGGLAWALNLGGLIRESGHPQQISPPSPSVPESS